MADIREGDSLASHLDGYLIETQLIVSIKYPWGGGRGDPYTLIPGACGSEEGSYLRLIDFCITQL